MRSGWRRNLIGKPCGWVFATVVTWPSVMRSGWVMRSKLQIPRTLSPRLARLRVARNDKLEVL